LNYKGAVLFTAVNTLKTLQTFRIHNDDIIGSNNSCVIRYMCTRFTGTVPYTMNIYKI